MKGDFTRFTYDQTKHYRSVLMQQGRVPLDADWNEQADIVEHRIATEAGDLIGPCGGPMHHDGFHIVATIAGLSVEEQARAENQNPPALAGKGDFYISGGRYYVDGILCENDKIITLQGQPPAPPDVPAPLVIPESITQSGVYLAYLDVWPRHITALEDKYIREVALGGPDTATRVKTMAQVKWLPVGNAGANINCLSDVPAWIDLIAPSSARLRARSQPDAVSKAPCIIKPGAGYRRLENQLYRVEIQAPGAVGTATFVWSRDNGAIATSWVGQNGDDLTVGTIGRDEVLRFATDQWIELIDDNYEVWGRPGTLVQVLKAEGQIVTIKPATATGSSSRDDFPVNPRIRRWDGVGKVSIPASNNGYLSLEDGVEIHFQPGATYKTGDYWLIPARTALGDIEWPLDNSGDPLPQPPLGIEHHYCRLAVLDFDGNTFTSIVDCRKLFPPVTELTSFFYLSGDGQEATPDPAQPGGFLALEALRVGVANGTVPVPGARVEFTILTGTGQLQGAAGPAIILTDANGVAACAWTLDSTTAKQQVEARLIDVLGNSVHLPVRFNAILSRAEEVSYDPANCPNLAGAKTVKDALDKLCKLGDGAGKCCCVSVGKDADFPQLDIALEELLKTETDICICLLPGDHHLLNGFSIIAKKETYVRIAGCGRASRIYLHKEQLAATNLVSYSLSDLCIFPQDDAKLAPLTITNCKQVNITGCFIRQQQRDAIDLLTISGAQRIVISDNVIESLWWQEPFRKFLGVDKLIESASLDSLMLMAATRLAKGGPKAQSAFVKSFAQPRGRTRARSRSIATAPAQEILSAISAVEIPSRIKTGAISELQVLIPQLLNAPAILIGDANGDLFILNNKITGEVRFYGTEGVLPPEKFASIAKAIPGKVKTTGRDAKIAGNDLTEVTLDTSIAQGRVAVFNRLSLFDNTFSAARNEWLATHVISNGNHFIAADKDTSIGTAAATSFSCVATSANLPSAKLRYAVALDPAGQPLFRESANLITLTPF